MSSSVRENAATTPPAADCWVNGPERAYSFGAYLRSRAGFALGAVALIAVVAGIMAVTGSNASAIALVSLCEALFACVALAADFLRDREFYQQLDLFCDSPENARYLSSILDEPRTLEGFVAYRALAVQGKAASDELVAQSRDMKEYRDYIELWVHEAKTPIASAQLALASLHGPEIGKVRGDLDRIESRVEQVLYYARSATLSEDFSIEELNLAALASKPAANGPARSSAQGSRSSSASTRRSKCSPTRNGPTSSSARSWRTRRSTARRPSASRAQ